MGLALWRTEDTYRDMQHIVDKVGEDVYTALTNPNQNKCTDQECDGKLVSIYTLLTLQGFFMHSFLGVATSIWRNNRSF